MFHILFSKNDQSGKGTNIILPKYEGSIVPYNGYGVVSRSTTGLFKTPILSF